MNAEMRGPSAENAELSKGRSECSLACFAICQEFYLTPFCPLWGIVNAEIGVPSAEKADISKVSRSEYSLACFATCQEFYLTPFCRQWCIINAEIGSPLLRIQSYRRLGQNIALRASPSARNSAVLLSVGIGIYTQLSMVRIQPCMFYYLPGILPYSCQQWGIWNVEIRVTSAENQSCRQLHGQNIALHASPSARNLPYSFLPAVEYL